MMHIASVVIDFAVRVSVECVGLHDTGPEWLQSSPHCRLVICGINRLKQLIMLSLPGRPVMLPNMAVNAVPISLQLQRRFNDQDH